MEGGELVLGEPAARPALSWALRSKALSQWAATVRMASSRARGGRVER
ncbi:hypothetical protein [Nonomuraea recticatena]